jgi:hypothetical protein
VATCPPREVTTDVRYGRDLARRGEGTAANKHSRAVGGREPAIVAPDRTAHPFYKNMVVLFAVVICCFTGAVCLLRGLLCARLSGGVHQSAVRLPGWSADRARPRIARDLVLLPGQQDLTHPRFLVALFALAAGLSIWRRRQIVRRGRSGNGNRRRRADATGPTEGYQRDERSICLSGRCGRSVSKMCLAIGALRFALLCRKVAAEMVQKLLGHASITTTSTYYTRKSACPSGSGAGHHGVGGTADPHCG